MSERRVRGGRELGGKRTVQTTVAFAVPLGLLLALVPALAGGDGASARGTERLRFNFSFAATTPRSPTGASTHIVYPDRQGTKPEPIQRLVLRFPSRSRISQAAVPECRASDSELFTKGLSACPDDSNLGGGTGSAVTGFGPPIDPVPGDLHLFHGPGEILNVATPPGSDRVLLVSHLRIAHRRLIDTPAEDTPSSAPGGPPDGQTVGKEIKITLERIVSAAGTPFLRTPRTCPAGGAWKAALRVTYASGDRERAVSRTPCSA